MKQHDSREREKKKKGPRVRQNGFNAELEYSLQGIFKDCPPGHGHNSRSRFSTVLTDCICDTSDRSILI